MTMLASLFHSPEEVEKMDLRLKVSREEKSLALFLVRYRQELQKNPDEPDSLKPFTDFIIDVSEKLLVSLVSDQSLKEALCQPLRQISPGYIQYTKYYFYTTVSLLSKVFNSNQAFINIWIISLKFIFGTNTDQIFFSPFLIWHNESVHFRF